MFCSLAKISSRLGFVVLLIYWTAAGPAHIARAAESVCEICSRCSGSTGGKVLLKSTMVKIIGGKQTTAECHAACTDCYIRGIVGGSAASNSSGKIKLPTPIIGKTKDGN